MTETLGINGPITRHVAPSSASVLQLDEVHGDVDLSGYAGVEIRVVHGHLTLRNCQHARVRSVLGDALVRDVDGAELYVEGRVDAQSTKPSSKLDVYKTRVIDRHGTLGASPLPQRGESFGSYVKGYSLVRVVGGFHMHVSDTRRAEFRCQTQLTTDGVAEVRLYDTAPSRILGARMVELVDTKEPVEIVNLSGPYARATLRRASHVHFVDPKGHILVEGCTENLQIQNGGPVQYPGEEDCGPVLSIGANAMDLSRSEWAEEVFEEGAFFAVVDDLHIDGWPGYIEAIHGAIRRASLVGVQGHTDIDYVQYRLTASSCGSVNVRSGAKWAVINDQKPFAGLLGRFGF